MMYYYVIYSMRRQPVGQQASFPMKSSKKNKNKGKNSTVCINVSSLRKRAEQQIGCFDSRFVFAKQ